jgi:outer membrane protein assembly factor BamB
MKRYSAGNVWRKILVAGKSAAAVCLGLAVLSNVARSENRLLSQVEVQRLGLTRAWFTQVRLDRARNHVERAVLEGNQLTVLTSAGVMQEINAQTGETLWIAPIGKENYPSLGPSCTEQFVALVNGSTLYVLDRKDGRPVLIRQVGGAPGAAPALAAKYVFVPLVRGRVEGYPLDGTKKLTPWYYQSQGRTMVAPLATPQSVVWTTESGYLYVGQSDNPKVRFRLETGSEIVAPPAYLKPFVYVAAASGELFAMNEMTGERRWKYATGFPVTRAAAPVGKRVFVTSEEPALHCIDAATGNMLWESPHVSQFSAASKERVYGVDDLGALVVLDGAKGTLLGRLATDHAINTLVNDQTDRIYLVSEEGVIECLHELGATEPLEHNPKPAVEKEPVAGEKQAPATAAPPAAQPKAPPPTDEESTPFEGEPEKADAPADKEPEKPAGDFGVEDNPFGN